MSRFMSVVWVMQFFALLALSVVLLFEPQTVPWALHECAVVEAPERPGNSLTLECPKGVPPPKDLPSDAWKEITFLKASVQLLVPFLISLAAFSLHAFMREHLRVRRQMARIFAVTGLAIILLLIHPPGVVSDFMLRLMYLSESAAESRWRMLLLTGSLCFLVLLVLSNLALALWPLPQAARRLSGSADTRPSQLWILWLIQGLGFCLMAAGLIQVELVKLVVPLTKPVAYRHLLDEIQQLAPPLFLSFGLLSFTGMRASREWGWRAFSRLFVLFYVSWLLVLLFVWQQEFNEVVLLFVIPVLLLLLLGNLAFSRKNDTWFTEEVGEGPDGWVLVDLLVGPLMLLKTVFTRKRALYERGVAARGTFLVTDYRYGSVYDQDLEQEFFSPGRHFEARVRFSSQGRDDAALAARGAALQLSIPGKDSFDVMLSTGAYSAASNIAQFAWIHLARALGSAAERLLWKYQPRIREGLLAALRRAPDSYARLNYHSQTVRFWVSNDGTRHLVRYRLVPEIGGAEEESGLPVPGKDDPAQRQRVPGERRPADYLRQEMKRRLEGRHTCTLRLEAQFHCPQSGDSIHWFNPATDWREDAHPWIAIGQLVLEEVLPDEQAERLCFNPANVPPSLGTPISRGLFDYRSIADSEKRVHRRLQKARFWMTESFGLPPLDAQPHDPT